MQIKVSLIKYLKLSKSCEFKKMLNGLIQFSNDQITKLKVNFKPQMKTGNF